MIDNFSIDNLHKKLSVCTKVDVMLETEGWRDIVHPRIVAMINSLSGSCNTDGLFSLGTIAQSKDEMSTERNIGIRIGMINVLNMIMSHPKEKEHIKKILEQHENDIKNPPKPPMVDSPYDLGI